MNHNLNKNQLVTASLALLGSALEYYNYMLFMYLIPFWGKELLGDNTDIISKGFLLVFLVSLVRPGAAFLIGRIGDRIGRRQALFACACIMSASCLIFACLPAFGDQNNIISQFHLTIFIVMICRVMQIISAAGKLNGSAIFLIEHLPDKAGVMSGLIWAITVLGMLVAALVEHYCSLNSANVSLWRIPTALGSLGGVIGLLTLTLREGKEYQKANQELKNHESVDLRTTKWGYVSILAAGASIGGMFHYAISYIPFLLKNTTGTINIGLYRSCILIVYALALLIGGILSDPKSKKQYIWPISLIGFCVILYLIYIDLSFDYIKLIDLICCLWPIALLLPLIWLVLRLVKSEHIPNKYTSGTLFQTCLVMFVSVLGVLSLAWSSLFGIYQIHTIIPHLFLIIALGIFVGPSHKMMNHLFPPNKRYQAISLCYAIGTALFGGSAASACLALEQFGQYWQLTFIIICGLLGILSVYSANKVDRMQITQ